VGGWVDMGGRELPDCPRLHLNRGAGEETGGEHALLAAVLDVLGDGGEGAAEGRKCQWMVGSLVHGGRGSYEVAMSMGTL